MNIKQDNSGVEKGRLKKSLGRKKSEPSKIGESKGPVHKSNKKSVNEYSVPAVVHMIETFQKEIIKPISFHTDVFSSNSLPKCIIHNNVLTLYCKNDRKPLCVSCLYLSMTHKPHKVIPLAKAEGQLHQDLSQSMILVGEGLKTSETVIKKNEENLLKVQKEYPQLIQKLHKFYAQFHEMLVIKKNEQLEMISSTWSRLRYTYHLKTNEIQKISTYIKNNLQSIKSRTSRDHLLHNRCIAVQIAKVKDMIGDNLGKNQDNLFISGMIKKMSSLKANVDNQLSFKSISVVEDQLTQNRSAKKDKFVPSPFVSKSRNKLNRTFNVKHTDQIIISQNIQRESAPNNKSLAIKNRHSKSDLLKKYQIEEQHMLRQSQQRKKKKNEYHSLVMTKSQKELLRKDSKSFKSSPNQPKKN